MAAIDLRVTFTKSFVDLMKLAVTGKFGSIFLIRFRKINGLSHRITDHSETSQLISPLLSAHHSGFAII